MKRATGGWPDRYALDTSAPNVPSALRDIGVRAVLPMLGLMVVNLGIGWLIVHPGGGWTAEAGLNAALQAGRTPLLDAIARAASTAGNAPSNIGACLVFIAVVGLVTRRWWMAVIPGLALVLEAVLHVIVSINVGRERPLVERLDAAQPTHSFPSGHVGATFAQVLILLFLAHRLSSAVARVALMIAGVGFIAVLAWSRLYLGMHFASDVAMGLVDGGVCALLAWNYLRRTT